MGNLFRKNCSDFSVYDYVIDPFGRTGSDIIFEVGFIHICNKHQTMCTIYVATQSLNGEPAYFIHCPTTGLVALIDTSISYYHFDPVG